MELKQVFGMRLRQSREASGYSLRGLESRMGAVVTYAQLSKYENGLDIPSSGVTEGKISLSKAAELANTTVERLQTELSTEGGE